MVPARRTLSRHGIARRRFLVSAVASVATPAVLRVAWADAPQITLKLHHALSAVSSAHDKFLAPWARKLTADFGGRLRVDLFPSMQLGGQPTELFDQVRDGVVDIAWMAPSDTPGRFPKTELFELPFVPARRALVSSKALQDYATANVQDEFREVRPLCFSCSDRAIVHTNQPVQTIDDIKGLRLHVRSRLAAAALQALGARPMPMPNGQLPMAITQHVIDGCVDPWNVAPALRLYDLLKAHTDFDELSLSMTTFVLAMNKTVYDKLPRDLKAVIDANAGQGAAALAGTMWDLEAASVADMVVQRGDAITTLLPDAVAHWRTATAPVIEAWLKQMKEHKVDGGRLLADGRALLEKYADSPEPKPTQAAQPAQQQAQPSAQQTQPPAQNAAPPADQSPQAKADPSPTAKVTPPANNPSPASAPPAGSSAAASSPATPSPAAPSPPVAKPVAPAVKPTASAMPTPPASVSTPPPAPPTPPRPVVPAAPTASAAPPPPAPAPPAIIAKPAIVAPAPKVAPVAPPTKAIDFPL